MFRKCRALFALLTTLAIFQGAATVAAADKVPEKVPLDAAVVAVLQKLDGVLVLPVTPKADPKVIKLEPGSKTHVETFPIAGEGKQQGKEFAKALAAPLLDTKTYSKTAPFGADYEPTVAFRIAKDKVKIDVVPCFKTGNVIVDYRVDGNGFSTGNSFRQVMPADTFNALLKLAQEARPDDKDLQRIQPRDK